MRIAMQQPTMHTPVVRHTPQGEDVTLDSLFKTRKGLPRHLMDQSAAAEQPGWGPDVRVCVHVEMHVANTCVPL